MARRCGTKKPMISDGLSIDHWFLTLFPAASLLISGMSLMMQRLTFPFPFHSLRATSGPITRYDVETNEWNGQVNPLFFTFHNRSIVSVSTLQELFYHFLIHFRMHQPAESWIN